MSLTNGDYVRVSLASDLDDQGKLKDYGNAYLEGQNVCDNGRKPGYLSFEFYQTYFDVDTVQVARRLMCALIPNPRVNAINNILKPHPDLYGPFWIASTLILAVAISGNIADYLNSSNMLNLWRYDFHKVTFASAVIYSYWLLAPSALYMYIHLSRRNTSADENTNDDQGAGESYVEAPLISWRHNIHLCDFLSIYGYSLAVFIPTAVLWPVQSSLLQWCLLIIAVVVSNLFLVFTLLPVMENNNHKLTKPVVAVVIVLHCVFAVALMITFFHGHQNQQSAQLLPQLENKPDAIGHENKIQNIEMAPKVNENKIK